LHGPFQKIKMANSCRIGVKVGVLCQALYHCQLSLQIVCKTPQVGNDEVDIGEEAGQPVTVRDFPHDVVEHR
jgi:hypothetical protein